MDNSELKSTERLLDICKKLHATNYISGLGAKNYMNYDLFEKENIEIQFMSYNCEQYPQLHGEFTPYVTIFDLIANCGKDGKKYINSKSDYWKKAVAL